VTLNASTQVYIVAPIPVNTVLKAGQTFPAGTIYTTSALSTAPLSATWTAVAPPLNTVTRIAFPVGATLAAGTTATAVNMIVTVNLGINASIPIDEIGDAFGKNTILATITDQSVTRPRTTVTATLTLTKATLPEPATVSFNRPRCWRLDQS